MMDTHIRKTLATVAQSAATVAGAESCTVATRGGPWEVCAQRCGRGGTGPFHWDLRDNPAAAQLIATPEYRWITREQAALAGLCLARPVALVIPLRLEGTSLGCLVFEFATEIGPTEIAQAEAATALAAVGVSNGLKTCLLAAAAEVAGLALDYLNVHQLLAGLVRGTMCVYGSTFRCDILLYDPVSGVLELRASSWLPPGEWPQYAMRGDTGPLGDTLHGNGARCLDLAKTASAQAPGLLQGRRCLAAAPLRGNGRALGLLVLTNVEPHPFTQEELWLLESVAGYAGAALENALLHRRMEELAMLDSVTGVYSRRFLDLRGGDILTAAATAGQGAAVLMVDVDHFKQVNDRYGHAVGDRVLAVIGAAIRRSIRATDVCARYGGEEFVAILPGADEAAARRVAERIRAEVRRFSDPPVTVSVGVAITGPGAADPGLILAAADATLYECKAGGRDCVLVRRVS